jgi:glycosyltransferase involved in cell wall biosynthesis
VLVDSETGLQQVAECYGMPVERIHVLPFIAPKYIRQKQIPLDFDTRYPLPGKFIFYPARFWEHKNHKNLIMALAMVREKFPDIMLVLAGSKSNAYSAVVTLVNDLGLADSVLFLGYVPDPYMAELYRRARALIMPTFFGPTNIPPLEAFTTGCPVAISDIFGSRQHYGDAALFFNPDSIQEIAYSIMKLWSDDQLCAHLIEQGRVWVSNWGQKEFNDRLREFVEISTKI